jgi:hypothetical protein
MTSVHAAVQATYYVSTSGNDSNNGTSINTPFRTIAKARDTVRTINSNMSGDIIVYLRGGTYSLADTDTVHYTEADSGTNGHYVRYESYTGEEAIIEGGTTVTGWTQDTGGVWKASCSVDNFRQLYVNGQRAQRARRARAHTLIPALPEFPARPHPAGMKHHLHGAVALDSGYIANALAVPPTSENPSGMVWPAELQQSLCNIG